MYKSRDIVPLLRRQTSVVDSWTFTTGNTYPSLSYGALFTGAVSIDSLIYRPGGEARSSSLGLLSEEQTINKCTNTSFKAVDTTGSTASGPVTDYTRVARSALPDQSWLDGNDPQVNVTAGFRLETSAAAGLVTIDGVTGNTNTHTGSFWVYVESGSFEIKLSGGTATTAITAGSWARYDVVDTPGSAADQLVIESTSAGVCFWFGNGMEENPYRTSTIEVAGSAVTRLGDDVSTVPSIPDYTAFTIVIEFQMRTNATVSTQRLLDLSGTTSLQAQVENAASLQRVTDTLAATIDGPAVPDEVITRWAYGIDGANLGLSIDGADQGTIAIPAAGPYTQITFGAFNTGIRQPNGYIRNVAVYDTPATGATRDRLSA